MEIYPDKVIVIVSLFDVGFIVDKEQYVSREKWSKIETEKTIHYLEDYRYWNRDIGLYVQLVA